MNFSSRGPWHNLTFVILLALLARASLAASDAEEDFSDSYDSDTDTGKGPKLTAEEKYYDALGPQDFTVAEVEPSVHITAKPAGALPGAIAAAVTGEPIVVLPGAESNIVTGEPQVKLTTSASISGVVTGKPAITPKVADIAAGKSKTGEPIVALPIPSSSKQTIVTGEPPLLLTTSASEVSSKAGHISKLPVVVSASNSDRITVAPVLLASTGKVELKPTTKTAAAAATTIVGIRIADLAVDEEEEEAESSEQYKPPGNGLHGLGGDGQINLSCTHHSDCKNVSESMYCQNKYCGCRVGYDLLNSTEAGKLTCKAHSCNIDKDCNGTHNLACDKGNHTCACASGHSLSSDYGSCIGGGRTVSKSPSTTYHSSSTAASKTRTVIIIVVIVVIVLLAIGVIAFCFLGGGKSASSSAGSSAGSSAPSKA